MNSKRYQALRSAPIIDTKDYIGATSWNSGGEGTNLIGDLLDEYIDTNLLSLDNPTDEDRYLALRNRNKITNEVVSVTYWIHNEHDSVNNGEDIFGEDMDSKIDTVFNLG